MVALAFLKEERSEGGSAVSAFGALRAAGWQLAGIEALRGTLMAEARKLKFPRGALGCGETHGLREDDRKSRQHQRERIEEALAIGLDTVIVSNDEIPVSCEVCRRYRGRVLSLSGLAYPEIAEFAGGLAEAAAAGLFHRGCFHDPNPYIVKREISREELNRRAKAVAERLGVFVGDSPDETTSGGRG
jgi:hypothetical protein